MKLTFLGTGTSFGIPQIGCNCARCRSTDPRDRRTRVGAVVETDLSGRGLVKGLSRAGQVLEGGGAGDYPFRVRGVAAVLVGSREREENVVTLKDLATKAQESFPREELAGRLGAARERR